MASETLSLEYPWIPAELLDILEETYIETGSAAAAQNAMRQSPVYETYFPGNRREDGTLRYDELGYYSYVERARLAISSVGVNPDLFGAAIVRSLAGGVQIAELESRVDAAFERVIDRAPEIRQALAQERGLEDLDDSAIVASFLDPEIGTQILSGQLTRAEIRGEAALQGFGVSIDFAERLRVRGGLTGDASRNFFGEAADSVPLLNVLARRHADPDDDFDINEFAQAALYLDPEQRTRMRRLISQERASFRQSTTFGSDQTLTGLRL